MASVLADFGKVEARVLKWLLGHGEVAEAVDLALAGREKDALDLLTGHVKQDLSKATAASDASAEEGEEESAADEELEEESCAASAVAASDSSSALDVVTRKRKADGVELDRSQRRRGQSWVLACQDRLDAARAAEAAKLAAKQGEAQSRRPKPQDGGSVPLYWKVDLPGMRQVLARPGMLPENLVIVEHPHITLLYLGGSGHDAAIARKTDLPVERVKACRETLATLQGKEVAVNMIQIIIEDRVAVAVVSLPPDVPCGSQVAHVTLATKQGVPPRYANEVLEDVQAGRTEGIVKIDLPPKVLKGKVLLHYGPLSS